MTKVALNIKTRYENLESDKVLKLYHLYFITLLMCLVARKETCKTIDIYCDSCLLKQNIILLISDLPINSIQITNTKNINRNNKKRNK